MTILIIEHDINISSVFREKLKSHNLNYKIVDSGVSAYKILYDILPVYQFDYVVTSINLPDENGVEIVKFIKAIFTTKVIIYTNKKLKFIEDKCEYDFFCDKKLYSPSDVIDLIIKLQN